MLGSNLQETLLLWQGGLEQKLTGRLSMAIAEFLEIEEPNKLSAKAVRSLVK